MSSAAAPPPATRAVRRGPEDASRRGAPGAPSSVADSTHFLLPGQIHASQAGSVVATILGSCVSICLVDPVRGVGGLNHFLLPNGDGHAHPLSTRFARPALGQLLERLAGFGVTPRDLEAKVFGGASVLAAGPGDGERLGLKNVGVAFSLLEDAGIGVTASDVGGDRGRKLVFDTAGGNAWIKLL